MEIGTMVLHKMRRVIWLFHYEAMTTLFWSRVFKFGKGMLEGKQNAFHFFPVKNLLKFEQHVSVGKSQFTQAF